MDFRVAKAFQNRNESELSIIFSVIFEDNRQTAEITVLVRRRVYESGRICPGHKAVNRRHDTFVIISERVTVINNILKGNIFCNVRFLLFIFERIGIINRERKICASKKLN